MRIDCPICGSRDSREFTYLGSARLMARPESDAQFGAWHDYVHLRDNPSGENAELWHHAMGCRSWLRVVRNVSTHEIVSVELAREAVR